MMMTMMKEYDDTDDDKNDDDNDDDGGGGNSMYPCIKCDQIKNDLNTISDNIVCLCCYTIPL